MGLYDNLPNDYGILDLGQLGTPSFFKYDSPLLTTYNNKSIETDRRFSPQEMVKTFKQSLVALSIYESTSREFTQKEFDFYNKSKTVNEKLKTLLIDHGNFAEVLEKFVSSMYGTGGDLLVYRKKVKGKWEIFARSFFENGKEAVGFIYDEKTNTITKYVTLDLTNSSRVLDVIDPSNAYHVKYANPFNSPLGITPAMVLMPLWQLKHYILGANETIYKNGIQAAKLISPAKNTIEGLNQDQQATLDFLLDKLGMELNDVTGLHNRNKTLLSAIPGIEVHDLQMNNSEMRTVEIVEKFIDKQTYIVYSQDPSNFDISNSKYNNGEMVRDDRSKAISNKAKDVSGIVENFIMPTIWPSYNKIRYPFRYTKILTQETLEEQNQRIQATQVSLDFFVKAKQTGIDVKFSNDWKEEAEKNFGVIIGNEHPVDSQQVVTPNGKDNEKTQEEGSPSESESEPEQEANTRNADEIQEVYTKYHQTVNMSASQLEAWSNNPCSKGASLDRSPIARNLKLLRKKKEDWTMADVKSANRTISFVSRMKGAEQGEKIEVDGKSCPSKRDISLKNWAYNPNTSRQTKNLAKSQAIIARALEKQLNDITNCKV